MKSLYDVGRWIWNPSNKVAIKHPDIRRSRYYDRDTIMLYVNFQILVDYVEYECGFMEPQTWTEWIFDLPVIKYFVPPIRNKHAGLVYLQKAMDRFDDIDHAQWAQKIYGLYFWWTVIRPKRKDPFDFKYEDRHKPANELLKDKKYMELCRLAGSLDKLYHKEDQEKLMQLIVLRETLWT